MKIFDVPIDAITKEEARAALPKKIIFTPNPEILLLARENTVFRKALKKADLSLPDGNGLLFVSTLMKVPSRVLRLALYLPALVLLLLWKRPFRRVFPEVIHGSDFMCEVIECASQNKWAVFFLGAREGVAEKTAHVFREKFPELICAGHSSLDPGEDAFRAVKESGAQVVLVAYGAPKQELWIAKYAEKIPKLKMAMAVGGSFDFWSGSVKRAPKWMRALGLEWLWRLSLNPRQRLKRIWNALVAFPLTCFSSSS